LRQDEISREEIFQDVTRCMQDNYFFREPATQKKLLDILFIYAKLNPDIGYRQGMHEVLAPLLWVIQQDAIDLTEVSNIDKQVEGTDFMLDTLESKYVEHDTFSLFCAVMQTAKAFYETGENKDSSAIVARSMRIHDDILAKIDPELALHMQVVGILPQIYSMYVYGILPCYDVLTIMQSLDTTSVRTRIRVQGSAEGLGSPLCREPQARHHRFDMCCDAASIALVVGRGRLYHCHHPIDALQPSRLSRRAAISS
jgi:hypothetical protein